MTEYASDHDYQRVDAGRGEAAVRGDHLLLMHILYTRSSEKRGEVHQEGYASLDSLREVSGLPAWRVWELIEDLQERDLVRCIWVSRGLRSPSAGMPRETSADLRFLRGTQAGLTNEGGSYPPLMEYHRLRQQRRWERPDPKTGRTRHRQALPSPRRTPGRRLERIPQSSGGYRIYRPREQAARRLVYLVVLLCVAIACIVSLLVLTLT